MASQPAYGTFTVKFSDQAESAPVTVYSNAIAIINGAAKAAPSGANLTAIPTAASNMQGMPRCKGRITVYFTPAAAVIIKSAESQFELPVIVYNDKGQQVYQKTLTQETMTGFTQAGAVTTGTLAAGIPARLCYYDVERGLQYAIDPNGKPRAYIGDNQ